MRPRSTALVRSRGTRPPEMLSERVPPARNSCHDSARLPHPTGGCSPKTDPRWSPARARAPHEIAWELAVGGLALVWVALGFLIDQIGSEVRPELEAAELLLTGVFVAEFVTRLTAAHDRRQYVRGYWIDALALAPPIRAVRC